MAYIKEQWAEIMVSCRLDEAKSDNGATLPELVLGKDAVMKAIESSQPERDRPSDDRNRVDAGPEATRS